MAPGAEPTRTGTSPARAIARLPVLLALSILVLIGASLPASAQIERLLEEILKPRPGGAALGSLSDIEIGAGLREALRIGAENAVALTGKPDGYFRNEAIKILVPEQVRSLERGLRLIGYGPQVDAFVLSMNRAAEQAAPFATQIFVQAIGAMTFDDVRTILTGPDDAATTYFRSKTTAALTERFSPVVSQAMDQVGVTRQYRALTGLAQAIPLFKSEAFDLDRYVVSRALDGLFHVLADEEKKIRTDPVARVTPLLQQVFGSLSK
jgi:hypothetical protein